jgi:hypothetical protein
MRIVLQELVVRGLHLSTCPTLVIRIALFDSLLRDTRQEKSAHTDYASVSAIVHRGGWEVRILVRTHKLVPLSETACDVRTIFHSGR